jgi:hypothetical protein
LVILFNDAGGGSDRTDELSSISQCPLFTLIAVNSLAADLGMMGSGSHGANLFGS